jgi:hypothetical protein
LLFVEETICDEIVEKIVEAGSPGVFPSPALRVKLSAVSNTYGEVYNSGGVSVGGVLADPVCAEME